MATKKKTGAAKNPKLKGGKAKQFPHIAEALTKPLGDQPAEGAATTAEAPPTPPADQPAEGAGITDETPTEPVGAQPAEGDAQTPDANTTTPPKAKGRKAKEAKPKKVGALDAAARVLEEAGQPMGCKEMIETMAKKGYWTSPGGLTPHATLYAAILREMKVKGKDSRFAKSDRGMFARTN